jgi:subtilase family serine protease
MVRREEAPVRMIRAARSVVALLMAATIAAAQEPSQPERRPERGSVLIPDSSVEQFRDIGVRAHTNHVVFLPPQLTGTAPKGETPASLACVYQTVSSTPGCPKTATTNPAGGSGTIAIVDAFDYPTAENDLNVFSKQFQLPDCTTANGCFKRVYATGSKPRANCGWAQEAALDIEWAHAMAPSAKIVLVEAASNSFSNLMSAVDLASQIVATQGSGEVSMSWGGSEFSTEGQFDGHFTKSSVVYFAASGDTGGAIIYPSASPNVVAAGGTTVNRDAGGNFNGEVAWNGSGGGPSKYESRPSYQDGIGTIVGAQRGVPDFSFDADPNSGVSVYDSTSCQGLSGWLVFGGTSVASPSLAGIVNLAGHLYSGSNAELTEIYKTLLSSSYLLDFNDLTEGIAGSYTAAKGWDFITGVGTNKGLYNK